MSLKGLANLSIKAALDTLILTREMQKMIIVFPDGMNDNNGRGHFFANQLDSERGDDYMGYLFDLVTWIDDHFQTK